MKSLERKIKFQQLGEEAENRIVVWLQLGIKNDAIQQELNQIFIEFLNMLDKILKKVPTLDKTANNFSRFSGNGSVIWPFLLTFKLKWKLLTLRRT